MSLKLILITTILSIHFEFLKSQSVSSIDSDNALCTCDLNQRSCDINCCCDPDCTNEIKKQFSTCLIVDINTNDRVCSYKVNSYAPETRILSNPTRYSTSGFCTYINNYDLSSFYSNRNPIRNLIDINSNISVFLLQTPTDVPSPSVQNINGKSNSLFPPGFSLSGNIGYIYGKPLMRAILYNESIILSLNQNLWWPLKSGDKCDESTITEPVLFGVNMITGCSIFTNISCNLLQVKSNQYLENETTLNKYLIASFANMSLINMSSTNLNDWVKITIMANQPQNSVCPFITTRIYEILYSRTGSTLYPHNKIIGIRAQSIYNTTKSNTAYLKTIINFIDVSSQKEQAIKLSPFKTIRLPYQFFYPIYTP